MKGQVVFMMIIVVVFYEPLLKMNETQLKVNVNLNEVTVWVVVAIGVWMKAKKIYEKLKIEKMILVKWVAWDGRIVDVDEGTDRESASTYIGEDKTACDGRIDKDEEVRSSVESEGVIKETDELFVGTAGGRAKLNDAGSNGLSWMVLDQMALLMEILLIWCWLLV